MEDKPKETQELVKKHKFLFQILSVTDDYYVFQSTLDKASNPVILTDTLCLNEVPICEMANKASYIIRLSKEGQTTFVAKVRKQETSITLDIKSGKKYFLRCELPWSLAPKPKLTEVSREEARPYFDKIK